MPLILTKKYGKLLLNNNFLSKIKEIRENIFGDDEKLVDIMAIPIGYNEYGLFWRPEIY